MSPRAKAKAAPRELIQAASRGMSADPSAEIHGKTVAAERAVLGYFLLPQSDGAVALPRLPSANDWQRETHRELAVEIERRRSRGEPYDEMALAMTGDPLLFEKIGGHSYMHALSRAAAPSRESLLYLIRRVESAADYRRMQAAGTLAAAAAAGGDLDEARAIFTAALSQTSSTGGMSLDEQVYEARVLIENALKERLEGRDVGLPIPWPTWRQRNPWRATQLGVIAARTGVGKTMIAAQAVIAALREGKRVVVYSLEVPYFEWLLRLAGHDAMLAYSAALNGQLSGEDVDALHKALEGMTKYRLRIVDKPGMTFDELMIDIDVGQTLDPADLIVVDHIGLVKGGSAYRHLDEHQMLGEVADGLKGKAKRHNCTMCALVQINRAGAEGPPQLQHLSGSDRIAMAADWIVTLDRPGHRDDTAIEDPLWLYMRKARSGESGWSVKMHVDWPIGRALEIDWKHLEESLPSKPKRSRTTPRSPQDGRDTW